MAIEKKMSRLSMLKKADTIFQVTVLACSVILAVVTQTYPARTRVFPELILYTLIFLSGTCLFLKFVSPRFLQYLVAPEPEEEDCPKGFIAIPYEDFHTTIPKLQSGLHFWETVEFPK